MAARLQVILFGKLDMRFGVAWITWTPGLWASTAAYLPSVTLSVNALDKVTR
jgi:hypothetical protein